MKKLVLILLLCLVGSAYGSEPFSNPEGLVNVPSGYVQGQGTLSFSYNTATLTTDTHTWSKYYSENRSNLSVHFNPYQNLELGVSSVLDIENKTNVGMELKFQVLKEQGLSPAIAVGGNNIGIGQMQGLYMVASKKTLLDTSFSIGVGNGSFIQKSEGYSRWSKGLFVGVKTDIGNTSLYSDLDGRGIQAGIAHQLDDNTRLNFAISEVENLFHGNTKSSRSRFIFGLSIKESYVKKSVLNDVYNDKYYYAIKYMERIQDSNQMAARVILESTDMTGPAMVVLNDKPVITLYPNKSSYFTEVTEKLIALPYERAKVIANRINKLILKGELKPFEIEVVDHNYVAMSGDTAIFTVTYDDACINDMTETELSQLWASKINQVINAKTKMIKVPTIAAK